MDSDLELKFYDSDDSLPSCTARPCEQYSPINSPEAFVTDSEPEELELVSSSPQILSMPVIDMEHISDAPLTICVESPYFANKDNVSPSEIQKRNNVCVRYPWFTVKDSTNKDNVSITSEKQKRSKKATANKISQKCYPKPKRQIFYHTRMAVLSMHGNNYTLCNSIKSVCVDDNPKWYKKLCKDIREMNVSRLFVVNDHSESKWNKVKKRYNLKLNSILLPNVCEKKCTFCQSNCCHRWLATIGAEKLFKFPIEPIVH